MRDGPKHGASLSVLVLFCARRGGSGADRMGRRSDGDGHRQDVGRDGQDGAKMEWGQAGWGQIRTGGKTGTDRSGQAG